MCCNCNAMSACCFGAATLKVGVLATAIYSMVFSLFYIILDIYRITVLETLLEKYDVEALVSYFRTVYSIDAIVYGIWLLFTIGLFIGWKVENRCLMMSWVIYTWILTVLLIIAELIFLTQIKAIFQIPLSAAIYVITTITIIGNIYCCLVVNSYYYSLAPPATQTTIVTTYPGNVQVQTTNTQGYVPVQQYGEHPAQYEMGKAPPQQGYSAPQQQGYSAPPQYQEKQEV